VSEAGGDAIARAESLLERLDAAREALKATDDPEKAIELLGELAQIAKEAEAELERARREAESGR
jgi:hypothetical protein